MMKDSATSFFKLYGLNIINLGVAGEFSYSDPEIQTAINTKITSLMKVSAADNEVDAANKFAQAADAIRKQKELDADVQIKLAFAEAIKSGNLPVPNTVVFGNGGSMLDLWAIKNIETLKK